MFSWMLDLVINACLCVALCRVCYPSTSNDFRVCVRSSPSAPQACTSTFASSPGVLLPDSDNAQNPQPR